MQIIRVPCNGYTPQCGPVLGGSSQAELVQGALLMTGYGRWALWSIPLFSIRNNSFSRSHACPCISQGARSSWVVAALAVGQQGAKG